MKKLLILLVVFLNALAASADGIYTKIEKYDKFDDVIWKKDIKTLITKTDSTIIIETKGEKPEIYYYYKNLSLGSGSRDSIVNIVANVYGYEESYCIFTKEDVAKIRENAYNAMQKACKEYSIENNVLEKQMIDYYSIDEIARLAIEKKTTITFRTISRGRNMFIYDTELAWIKFKDGSRIIYSK